MVHVNIGINKEIESFSFLKVLQKQWQLRCIGIIGNSKQLKLLLYLRVYAIKRAMTTAQIVEIVETERKEILC